MKKGLFHIVIRSLTYYKRAVLNQILIIAILAAVITGSLLTGFSVRKSLKDTAFSRLGNSSILISSGLRFFDPSLSERFSSGTGEPAVSIFETEGFCQNFSTGVTSRKIKIYGTGNDFFVFNDNDSVNLNQGEVAINKKLADQIGVSKGEEIIVRFKEISDIPANAPFSTVQDESMSMVMKVGEILSPEEGGDFALGISQIAPLNIFINLDDLETSTDQKKRVNRIIAGNINNEDIGFFSSVLNRTIDLSDIGLSVRKVESTGESEIISDRIFIDQIVIDHIKNPFPEAEPVITYMANSIKHGNSETPYSFISALPSELYPGIEIGNEVTINSWMASDLNAESGDTVRISWFSPDSINQLIEKSGTFTISNIVEMDSIWGDRTLMPEFPGISGSESCSDWDAGVPIKTDRIRDKDEDYWNDFKGTPKAFISYDKGKELWANNFGPATAIRFPGNFSVQEIEETLSGTFTPDVSGFFVTDLREEAIRAAGESVDFGTLFLSLAFFIIFSSFLLLSLSVSEYFNSKKQNITTLFALGFTDRFIRKSFLLEAVVISFSGSGFGILLGLLVNNQIIKSLNTVWQGAVQTSTLSASAGLTPLFTGFISSLFITIIFFQVKTVLFLKSLKEKKEGVFKTPSLKTNSVLLITISILALVTFTVSVIQDKFIPQLSFIAGVGFFLASLFILRHYYLGGLNFSNKRTQSFSGMTGKYYRHNSAHAIAPVIFIAAGIFALFITSLNRMNFDQQALDRSGGTGGYLLWTETNVPVKEDLTTAEGKGQFGLDEDIFKEMTILQFARKDGNDASCLNLNYIAVPPLLGIEPAEFLDKNAFSFVSVISDFRDKNPWESLNVQGNNTIYGIADQTVLDWGLKIKVGDTIIMRAETGQPVNIIIAAGLKTSIFQGNVLVGAVNLRKYFPSVSGNSVFLIEGNRALSETYKSVLENRFVNYGILVEPTHERLASFYRVTNTYLTVFTVLGAFGMILGVFGLGFILLRNYNLRKHEFALLSATGFSIKKIRKSLFSEMLVILTAGIFTGVISAIIATLPSIQINTDLPWKILIIMIISIFFTGVGVLLFSVRSVRNDSLISILRKE